MKKIAVINGPNLNMLGSREPGKYGTETLDSIIIRIEALAASLDAQCEFFQSNIEGEIVTAIQEAGDTDGIILNAGAYTHTSVAIRDAVLAVKAPVVEVHLTNVMNREEFRHISMISAAAKGVISGFGGDSYLLALRALTGF